MKWTLALLSMMLFAVAFGQIEQLQTNCTGGIGYLKDSDTAKYFVSAQETIIRYSKANDNLTFLPVPHYTNGFNSGFEILGDSIFYVSTFFPGYPYPFKLSRSRDFGQTWDIMLDTVCDKDLATILVMDTNTIYLLAGSHPSLKTSNGGLTWIETVEIGMGREYLHFDDTTAFITWAPGIKVTTNGGATWNFADNGFNLIGCNVYGFHVKAIDSLFAASSDGCNLFSYCFSSDYSTENWHNVNASGYLAANDIFASSIHEIYLIGYKQYEKERIARTTDLGSTFQIFDPGINGQIANITPINDSVFLVCGEYGVLYKWNKNQTQWGTLGVEEVEDQTLKISPNPSAGIFTVTSDEPVEIISVSDGTGKEVNYTRNSEPNTITLGGPTGLYFLHLLHGGQSAVYKLIVD